MHPDKTSPVKANQPPVETVTPSVAPLVVRPKTARSMLAGCSEERLYQWLNSGELKSFKEKGALV